ncbi:hypothetical protein [Streptomyces sp. NPDC048142]|uniref:hypothetical protein n=1 Tax=Streptomyces sp. NPDC048142 TaxID=3365501 RepID=UPI003723BB03
MRFGKGISWVSVNCLADTKKAKLTLVIDTVGSFTTSCPSDEVRFSVNQMDLLDPFEGQVRIEAPDSVKWMASIQVPAS